MTEIKILKKSQFYSHPHWTQTGQHQGFSSSGAQDSFAQTDQRTNRYLFQIQTRQAVDTQLAGEVKAIKKGKDLEKGQKVHACSVGIQTPNIYMTGIVGAMYKGAVTYWFKLKLHKNTGDALNSHCECPGGKGPHGTCKHVAAVLQMISNFVNGRELEVESSCTEVLQTFHKPKKQHTGKPTI